MVYDIIIGRNEADRAKYGKEGAILVGKHYVKMGQVTSLSNEIYMDVASSHVVFVCGKRGSGKSYSMGVIAEGMAYLPDDVKGNLSVIMLDTMGVYWTMKYANKKENELLKEWNMEGRPLDVKVYTPIGYFKRFKEEGIPTDFPFSIKPSELSAADWCLTFDISLNEPAGVLIERVIEQLKEEKKDYGMDDITGTIQDDKRTDQSVKDNAENRFLAAKRWGIFSKEGTPIEDLARPGQATVIDLSAYAIASGAEGLRALVIGLIAQKLFVERMIARKAEEFESIRAEVHYLTEETKAIKKKPLVWLVVDEAHEFIPNDKKTAATNALITILREGRQPGISLILASQQPGKIHTDVMTQSDIVIAHRVTAKVDVDALGTLMQNYMREGLDKQLDYLPRVKGAAIIFDDVNERMYPMRVRPRFTWHGGEAPTALAEKKKIFSF